MTQLPVFTLTPQAAAQALQDEGLDALGLTIIRLSNTWASATPTFDDANLRLTNYGNAAAPFRGTLEYIDDGAEFRSVNGDSIAGPVGAFRLHPQAVQRLGTLLRRYASAPAPHHRLVPETLVFSGAVPVPDRSPQTYEPGENMGRTEPMSFHDARGLIIDPIAIAAIFDDLIAAFPALDFSNGAGTGGAGGVGTIASLASGIEVQVADLHGRPFQAPLGDLSVEAQDGSNNQTGLPGPSGRVTVAATDVIAGAGTDAATRLRLGWATGGVMSPDDLALPTLPGGVSLPRQFFRAYAVDLDWHLRGNRSASVVAGVPAEDGDMPDDLKLTVRSEVQIDYLVDGPDTVAAANRVVDRLATSTTEGLVFLASPLLHDAVPAPPAPGAAAHWPAFPASVAAGTFGPSPAPLTGATATWLSGEDVLVVLAPDSVPDGAAVRLYSQSFVTIDAIGETPSFIRGDGGASIATAGQPTQIRVRNPLNLASGDPKPAPATLVFDLVVMPRGGGPRSFAARSLAIQVGPAPDPPDVFASPIDRVGDVNANVKSVAPTPIFGTGAGNDSPAGTPVAAARALASETVPRIGPRQPTMGRLETVFVSGLQTPAFSAGFDWDAIVSGAPWTRDALSAAHRQGNPGNPAGPDMHVGAVRVTGALAYDLARHAVRRAQPLIPLPGGPPPAQVPGFLAFSGGNNMNEPVRAGAPPATASSSGVLLQTVAAISDTPELSLLPDTTPLASDAPIDLQQVINDIAATLSLPSPTINVTNGNRLLNELRREYFTATHGARDALWSLARAFSQAEELVYIETAGLARTAHPGAGAGQNTVDLIQILADRLGARPKLRIVICTPRETDFVRAPYVRRAIQLRTEAVAALTTVAEDRVAAFHPMGFPGRAAKLPSTTIIVDDVYSMTGATHLRRRGMTFDGSVAIASLDHTISQGVSDKIRSQRIQSLAARLGVQAMDMAGLPTSEFIRLQTPLGAFSLIRDLIRQNGLGLLEENWAGPSDTTVLPQSVNVTDPDGSTGGSLATLIADLLA